MIPIKPKGDGRTRLASDQTDADVMALETVVAAMFLTLSPEDREMVQVLIAGAVDGLQGSHDRVVSYAVENMMAYVNYGRSTEADVQTSVEADADG